MTNPTTRSRGLSYEGFEDKINHTNNDTCKFGTRDMYCVKNGWDNINKFNCCSGTLNDSDTCAPEWCPGSASCGQDADIISFCSRNNGQNIKDVRCQKICKQNTNIHSTVQSIQTWCDSASEDFCSLSKHKDDDYCGCINSKNNNISPIVLCAYPPCGISSYKTKELQNNIDKCLTGTKTICSSIIACVNSKTCKFNNITFELNCKSKVNGGTTNGGTTNDGTTNIISDYTIYCII